MMANTENSDEETVVCCAQKVSLKTATFYLGLCQALSYGCILIFCIWTAMDVSNNVRDTGNFSHLDEKTRKQYLIVLSIAAVVIGLNIICGMMLAYGARKEDPAFIRPWIPFEMVFMVVLIFLYIMAAVGSFSNGNPQMGTFLIFLLIADTVNGLRGIMLVKKYLKKLKETGVTTSA
ncbi:uncharacterized protein [Anabrus simplex]|uniref:uncharacterized protein n=1 Tax=Anabrus simplex TaxID=316456 RepID=UPI0035A39239